MKNLTKNVDDNITIEIMGKAILVYLNTKYYLLKVKVRTVSKVNKNKIYWDFYMQKNKKVEGNELHTHKKNMTPDFQANLS